MREKLGIIKESDLDIDTLFDCQGHKIEYDKDRPEVIYLKEAHSIMVIVKGKKFLYNWYDIPVR